MHTTGFSYSDMGGWYGNFIRSTGVPTVNLAPAILFNGAKDGEERFLDEVYRYPSSFNISSFIPGIDNTVYGLTGRKALAGPGLQGYVGGPIEVPVRAGLNAEFSPTKWARDTWVSKALHIVDFNNHGGPVPAYDGMVGELQVRGWPDRNPPLLDGAKAPFPSSGILAYPKRDYSVAGSPNLRPQGPSGAGDMTREQPDYSGFTGVRSYVRCFSLPTSSAGKHHFALVIEGLTLSDIAYSAPGPGGLARTTADGSTFVAVQVKIPGMTTWMDVGRPDGSGPSKQDPLLDGAGCQVLGDVTADLSDGQGGLRKCAVECHVGPVATLFATTGIEGTKVGEVPVLVRVLMDHNSKFDMAHEYEEFTDTFTPVAGAGASNSKLRGICKIEVRPLP